MNSLLDTLTEHLIYIGTKLDAIKQYFSNCSWMSNSRIVRISYMELERTTHYLRLDREVVLQ